MSEAQRAYESRRAAKAGMNLDKWLAAKEKRAELREREAEAARAKPESKKPGLISRLLERARKPL